MKLGGKMLAILLTILNFSLRSQNDFRIENDKGEFKQKFELVNDLVIIPVEVNGSELVFLLDTGVKSTLLFSFSSVDTSLVKDPSTVYLKGMGGDGSVKGFISDNNTLKIGDVISSNLSIYLIEGAVLNISNRLGVPINGIIGYDFFKNFVVEFNYRRKRMKIYDPSNYEYKSCRRCVDLPLEFYEDKPYLKATVSIEGSKEIPVDLLIDSGSGDALWLFKDEDDGIYVPDKSFEDFLGFGISGSVYGDRSRIERLSIGEYNLEDITVSFPDTIYLESAKSYEKRNGSIGGQVLKRFHSVFNYPAKNLRLKPNGDFKDDFEYNMSGIVVEHNGFKVVKNDMSPYPVFQIKENSDDAVKLYSTKRQVVFSLEQSYRIAEIRPGSPAEQSGLQIGDELIKLNGRPVYRYNLQKIFEIFSSREGKKIRLEVLRNGKSLEFEFRLERIL